MIEGDVGTDEDTISTEDDGLLDQLRVDGLLGPFDVVDRAGGTDVGLRRPDNQDRWGSRGSTRFAVADGVGGNDGGSLAAETAMGVVLDDANALTETGARDILTRANAAVRYAGELAGTTSLGTTLVLLSLHENHFVLASIGDSRAYRLRDGELEPLTRDHNIQNELVASGVGVESVRSRGIRLDALTAYLGMETEYAVPCHVASYSIMTGDRVLLCSDGVHGQLPHEQLTAMCAQESCQEAVDSMMLAAREAGGRDNATAVMVEFASRQSIR